MTLRSRLLLVLAILASVTVVAMGFSYVMFMRPPSAACSTAMHAMVGELRATSQQLNASIKDIGIMADHICGSTSQQNVGRQVASSIDLTQTANESLSRMIGEISALERAAAAMHDLETLSGRLNGVATRFNV